MAGKEDLLPNARNTPIGKQNNIANFLELKNKLNPLCKKFVDFGNYLSENIQLD